VFTTKSLYTKAGFQINQNIHWEILTNDQCEAIVLKAMELLERTGVDIHSPQAVEAFQKAGCYVEGARVRIPSARVEWALRVKPDRLTLCDRTGGRALLLETNQAWYGPGYGCACTVDLDSGETRDSILADVAVNAKLADSLPAIDFAMAGCFPTDAPEKSAPLHEYRTLASFTKKPIVQNVKNAAQGKAVLEMASAIAGSAEKIARDPNLVLHIENSEPLSLSGDPLDALICAAEQGVPAAFSNRLITGLTAPRDSAGALIVALAKSLAALCLTQLIREGAPFITGGFFTIRDRRNDTLPYGAPEISLLGAGFSAILRALRIPSLGFGGGTDAIISDAQLGLESTFSILHAGLAGTGVICGAGTMEGGSAASPALLTLSDELIGMTRRIICGVQTDEDRLARGVIDAVQPGGHYLGTTHTRYYFKKEQFWPTLMNRMRIDDWTVAGEKTLGVRSTEKAKKLIDQYEGEPLEGAITDQLLTICENAEKAL
jgi:trimethylamine--corrinoid protein Co-methyltransferase